MNACREMFIKMCIHENNAVGTHDSLYHIKLLSVMHAPTLISMITTIYTMYTSQLKHIYFINPISVHLL